MLDAAILYILAAYAEPAQLCTQGGYRCEALVRCNENAERPAPQGYELVFEACNYIEEWAP